MYKRQDLTFLSGTSTFKQKFKVKNPEKPTTVVAEFTYQTCNDKVCLAPEIIEFEKKIDGSVIAKTDENLNKDSVTSTNSVVSTTSENATISPKQEGLKVASLDFENPLTDCGVSKEKKSENYLTYLFLGFLGGLIALLTPVSYTHLDVYKRQFSWFWN